MISLSDKLVQKCGSGNYNYNITLNLRGIVAGGVVCVAFPVAIEALETGATLIVARIVDEQLLTWSDVVI